MIIPLLKLECLYQASNQAPSCKLKSGSSLKLSVGLRPGGIVMGLLKDRVGGYTLSKAPLAGVKGLALSVTRELFAEIALDVNVKDIAERLFTYEIPEHLHAEVFIGSQVLVPFGRQELVSGFVVSIRDRLQVIGSASAANKANTAALPETIRPISEVLDSNPLFEPRYIEFLYWISEYYLCSIADVLSAAIPGEIGPRSKRMVRLLVSENEEPNELLSRFSQSPAISGAGSKIKSVLVEAGKPLSMKALKDRSEMPTQSFYANIARLRRAGEIEVFAQAEETASPKLVSHVVWTGLGANTKRQEEIINCLKHNNGSLPQQELITQSKCTTSTIKRMVSEGILSIQKVDSFRDPLKRLTQSSKPKPELTEQQGAVLEVLFAELKKRLAEPAMSGDSPASPWLLHGVTGSGKTEIYLRLIEETLQQGRTALLMVPEISLTPQLAERLVSRFGDKVAVWHSALSAGERFDTFRRIQSGELKLVLGARSAILANIPQLGLIILDEEHDGSYKQSKPNPRYSAKHLACQRAWRESCFVLLGSATPDTSTYFEARNANRIVRLPKRVFEQALPESVFVDMRNEFSGGNKSIISRVLHEELIACLERKEQAILLINRRGYASHVFCRACGEVLMCKHCSVSLVFHSQFESGGKRDQRNVGSLGRGRLSCHHCGFQQQAVEACPACHGPFLKQFGLGTQKVEEETHSLLPDARILRLDSDITTRKGAYEEIFHKFVKGDADILIGTQIVAKGLDIARVTLVGVLAADAAFNLPDFRSLERGFQLLTQVSGRAGRGEFPGKVILQTHNTELPALIMAKNQDYDTFIEAELASRKAFEYPPFSRVVRVVASGPDDKQVQSALERVAEELSNYLEELEQIRILGPAPCLIERIQGLYRHHLIIKNLMGETGQRAIASFFRGRASMPGVRLIIDVDPVDLI